MNKKIPVIILPIALVAVAAIVIIQQLNQPTSTSSRAASAPRPTVSPATIIAQDPLLTSPTSVAENIMLAGGIKYDETVFYNNPGGGDEVRFIVTVDKEGVITAADAEVKAVNQVSQGLQTKFKSEMAQAVVGKKVADLNVDRIGGASLTTGAFKKFLSEIQT